MTRKQLIRDCDILWSKIILKRAKGKCELGLFCALGHKRLQCHHIWGRGYSVRYNLDCGSGVCLKCHDWCTDHPTTAKQTYRQIRGEFWYQETHRKYRQTRQYKVWELEELREDLTKRSEELNGR